MPETPADRLEAATREARQLLSDLHTVGKDLRRTLKEAKQVAAAEVGDLIAAECARLLGELGPVTEEQMRKSVDKVIAEFDRLGAILLGVDKAEPIEVMVAKVAAASGRGQVEAYEQHVDNDLDVLDVHR